MFCSSEQLEDVQRISKPHSNKYNPNVPNDFYIVSSILQDFFLFLGIWGFGGFLIYQFPDPTYFWYICAPEKFKIVPLHGLVLKILNLKCSEPGAFQEWPRETCQVNSQFLLLGDADAFLELSKLSKVLVVLSCGYKSFNLKLIL